MSSPPPGAALATTTPPSLPGPPSPVVLILPPSIPDNVTRTAAATPPPPPSNSTTLVALGMGIGIGGAIVLVCVGIFVIWYKRRKKRLSLGGFAYAPSQGSKDDPFHAPQYPWQHPASPPSGNIIGEPPNPTLPLGISSQSQSSSVDGSTKKLHLHSRNFYSQQRILLIPTSSVKVALDMSTRECFVMGNMLQLNN
ncbi:hypothetical protein BUALT_BualtUnG0028200 [Buddleja alternifolia]|uniref:Uncharacterized protein n=1 Tax=Buddleja alternifolia TaxID=168488 RepID=A0AAV6W181_9LAMI|nr:hypothetical protein BUALT_BualtUnG0028200 [Buddleja alternifolia]